MTFSLLRRAAWIGGFAAAFVGVTGPAFAQQGKLSGTVTDRGSGSPLEAARLLITGTGLIETSNQKGEYTFRSVAPGTYQVRVLRIGYRPGLDSVTIGPEETAALNFELTASPVELDEIVTTASGVQRKLEVPNAIATIDAATITQTQPITEIGNLLSGRAAGVQVDKSGGTTGTGTRIRIRGSNSISLSNEPLYYVDGVRVESEASSLSIDVGGGIGGGATSRINDINPDEIESIEIVKGPAAATLYGIQASNGVVRITTKRGNSGKAKWNVTTELGAVHDYNTYLLNYIPEFTVLPTAQPGYQGFSCTIQDQLDGNCTVDSLHVYSPLQNPATRPLKTGLRQLYSTNVSGGNELATYYFGATYESEDGVFHLPAFEEDSIRNTLGSVPRNQVRPNALQKTSLRANATANVSRNADLSASVGYVSSDTRVVENDNSFLTITGSAEASTSPPSVDRGWYFIPAQLFAELSTQGVERFTGGLTANWRPTGWLSTRATLGYDVVNRNDVQFFPTGKVADYLSNNLGVRTDNRLQMSQTSVDLGATARFKLSPAVGSRTSVGGQFFRDLSTGTFATGRGLAPGSSTISGAGSTESSEQTLESRTVGGFVEEEVNLRERLFVAGALRVDDNSAFGNNLKATPYPKASVNWLLSEEPFFHISHVKTLRLRGAYGASIQQPGTNDAKHFFRPVTGKIAGSAEAGITVANLGNSNLKPERSTELELGADGALFDGRLSFEFTYYHKITKDLLLDLAVVGSAGQVPSQFENAGKMRNQGIELALDARIIESPKLTWDLTLSGSINHNKVLELTTGDTIFVGFYQRHVVGYPAGGLWSPTVRFNDANNDGIIELSEVSLDSATFRGNAMPSKEASLNSTIGLFNGKIQIGTQFDYRGGYLVDNSMEQFRCFSLLTCRGLNDRTAPLAEQARAQALFLPGAGNALGFFEPGWFIKLRELSLTYEAPAAWTRALRASRLSLTLAARNLLTITDYSGVDPEVNAAGQSNFFTTDFESQPQVRYWIARVNLSF